MIKYLLALLLLTQTVKGEETVVCIHGFFRSFRSMAPVAKIIRKAGFRPFLWDYPSRRKTIEEHTEDLVTVLRAIADQNPSKPIHFVTHSLGGIIVRKAVSHPDCPQEAKLGKAILLAPPNRGSIFGRSLQKYTPVRWIVGNKTGQELITYSEEDMSLLGTFPDTMAVMVIAGTKKRPFFKTAEPSDGTVTVEETRLSTPHTHAIINTGHTWIMSNSKTLALIKEFLAHNS